MTQNNENWDDVHMKFLEKSECAKDCGEYTVIRLGHAVSIAKELISQAEQRGAENLKKRLEEELDEIDGEGYDDCGIAVSGRIRSIIKSL